MAGIGHLTRLPLADRFTDLGVSSAADRWLRWWMVPGVLIENNAGGSIVVTTTLTSSIVLGCPGRDKSSGSSGIRA
jgi:hypothetical protein